jgi:glycosyltransferase involved in cell wall biosynthesis
MYYYVDHTSRFGRNTGIQRCVRAIATALLAAGVPLRPVLWNRERLDFEPAPPEALQHLGRWSGPSPAAWAASPPLAHSGDAGWLLIVELVSGPHQPTAQQLRQAADRHGLRLAWVFHDAIPLRWAHLYGAGAAFTAACHRAYMAGLAAADLVLANSRTSADHLRLFLHQQGLPAGHVQALPLAEEFPGVPRGAPGRAAAPRLNSQRLLCVGSLEPRKNHAGLLKAVAFLVAAGRFPAELVLVGWPGDPRVVDLVQRALDLGLPLRWEADADDERLAELYRWCDATLVVSLEEGFGLPVAESLWHGRPCLCSGEGALGELAAGGGCWRLRVQPWRALAEGLDQWLAQPQLRQHTRQQLLARATRSWADYGQELIGRLEGVAANSRLQPSTPAL